MTWIVPASFICGALALVHSLHDSGLKFNRVRNARKALGHVSREFKDSLRCIARRNKVWIALIGALGVLFLYTREYGASFALWAGVVAPICVGSLSAAIRIALSERSTDVDCQAIQYKSKFLPGQMVMACGLLGSAAILCLASLEDLRRLGMGTFVLVSFAFGVSGGVVLFLRTFSAKTVSPTYGPATKAEARRAAQTAESEPETADLWRATSWDVFIYGNYTCTFVAAAVIARNICGVRPHAAQMPLLIGTIGLMACWSASSLIVGRHWRRLSHSQVTYYLTIGGAFVLAAATLFLLGEELRIEPLLNPLYEGKDANLLPSALVGILLTGLMILVTEVYVWQHPAESQELAVRPTGNSGGIILRATVATFKTIFPLLVAPAALFAEYHLINSIEHSRVVGIFGIAMTVVSSMSVSGISGVFESEDRRRALRRFYGTETLTLVGLCLFMSYTMANVELGNKNLAFDLSNPKILLGLLIGGLIPYLLVSLLAVAIVKGITSLAREIAFRYRSMR